MVGDATGRAGRSELQQRLLRSWLDRVAGAKGGILVVEMGAGTAMPWVCQFSHRIRRDHGARIVRINPRERQVLSSRALAIAAGSLEALMELLELNAVPKRDA